MSPRGRAPDEIRLPPVRHIGLARPLDWVVLGWEDFIRVPLPSLAHGLALVLGAALILTIGFGRYSLLVGAFTGFVLVAPALLVGLYELSRRLALGQTPGLRDALSAWRRAGSQLLRFGALLAAVGTVWVGISALIVSVAGGAKGAGFGALIRYFVVGEYQGLVFAWILGGGLLASIVFAVCAVSIPMLLDRGGSLRTAMLASAAAVGNNPVSMGIWALVIMTLTLLSLITLVGAVVLVPVLGHASWHAYRELIGDAPDAAAASGSGH